MTIAQAIESARKDKRHESVRKDVAEMIRRREAGCQSGRLKISALTAFILERCFDKRKLKDVDPEDILAIID
jgi:hypothetical protein